MSVLLRDQDDAGRVGTIELYYDIVFVFAVTQLSHALVADLSLTGMLQVSLLVLAVWWVWIYTCWVTNWLDPGRIPVRLCLLALLLAGLVMSVSIPQAFAQRGLFFAGAYAFMQVGRTLFFLWAARDGPEPFQRTFQRILVWLAVSGALWLAGAHADGWSRFALWLVALALEMAGPWLYFAVPGLGRSSTTDWNVHGGHMAERCGLFVIIALGESLLVTGATFARMSWNDDAWAAFVVAVLGSVLLWWIYFDTGAQRGEHRITHSTNPGRLARLGYTYLHLPIVAGIIACAVGDEIMLLHPGHVTPAGVTVLVGGPASFLAGAALFKWVTNYRRTPPLSHLVGLGLLSALLWWADASHASALQIGTAAVGVLLLVAVWESLALRKPQKA
jgi:low temperature requirement protein LtrA